MSIGKRLKVIEMSLTPKQQVLRWLEEVQQLSIGAFQEMLTATPFEDDPHVRVPEMAARAVRASQDKTGDAPELLNYMELAARKQAAFLVALVLRLHEKVMSELLFRDCNPAVLKMQLTFLAWDGCPASTWSAAQTLFQQTLSALWHLSDTIADISLRYFDAHPVLLADVEAQLEDYIVEVEGLASEYNAIPTMPSSCAIDFAGLQASIESQLPAAIQEVVACANAKVLLLAGDRKGAWDLMKPYVLASLEKTSFSTDRGRTS